MSKLLIEDNPLIISPKLAKKIGLNESIILQQIHYWLKKKINSRDGYYWVYNSYPKWVKQFPFWSESTIKRTISSLENKGLLITGNYNAMKVDKTKWYRINYDILATFEDEEVFDGRESPCEASGQNEPTIVANRHEEQFIMNRPLPEITTKTTTEKDIKDNVQSAIERDFDEFWKFYPNKKAKKTALVSYTKIIKAGKYNHEHIMNGLMLYLDYIKATNTQSSFIAHPTTYLNQERFNDELVIPTNQYNNQQTFRFGGIAHEQAGNGNDTRFNRSNISGQIEGW